MWDNILTTQYQKQEVEAIISKYILEQDIEDSGIAIKIDDIIESKVYLRISESCTATSGPIEGHFQNLQDRLLQTSPGIVAIHATLQRAFSTDYAEVTKDERK